MISFFNNYPRILSITVIYLFVGLFISIMALVDVLEQDKICYQQDDVPWYIVVRAFAFTLFVAPGMLIFMMFKEFFDRIYKAVSK